ncbi:hypothetical protein BA20089_08670 [Bifidobacterium asteroides DSM 20089]|uniref:SGNH hydrolase-type esterase domain-containing protein n=2 Tax=Bifidobacterium asteroides TaxID=1684 RepID=A0AAD0ABH1_9BIFI|nr:hypothetical protein BA20089_00070 [Bifidobacterium asteroides DSM 20089]ATO42393.1 hypothetical protein BA20089_08670 [Bifidobacterium asteroides DSM 20089]
MRVITLPEGGSVRIFGVLDIEQTQEGGRYGLRPLRLPKRYFAEFPRFEGESMRTVVSGCAGVRISFVTSAEEVRLTARCTRIDYGELPSDLNDFVACVDGEKRCSVEPKVNIVERIPRDGRTCERHVYSNGSVLRFPGLGAGEKIVTIWFPQTVIVDLIGISGMGSENGDIKEIKPAPYKKEIRWLHYGSSISHCHLLRDPTSAWPSLVAKQVGLDLTNLGYSGQCMLDQYVARAIAQTACDIMTITAGVNITGERSMNQRTFIPAVHGFLDIIRQVQPNVPIVLFSSILWPGSDDIPGPSDVKLLDDGRMQCYCYGDRKDAEIGALTLRQSRLDLQYVVEQRSKTDSNLYYFDGLTLFGNQDAGKYHLVDGLHPDVQLFSQIAKRFAKTVFGDDGLVPITGLRSNE